MKKILALAITFFALNSSALAASIKVVSLENFSTKTPNSTYKAEVLESCALGNGFTIYAGEIISGNVLHVEPPKRGKRNGYFHMEINEIASLSPYSETERKIKVRLKASVIEYTPLSPKDITISAARTTAGFFVKGATQGISFVQGFAKADEGERLKSGIVNVYKTSPLSYIEVGKELEVRVGDTMLLKIEE